MNLETIMILGGLYLLVTARFDLFGHFQLRGWQARLVGLLWIAPLPLTYLFALMTGLLIGLDILPSSAAAYIRVAQLFTLAIAIAGTLIFAYLAESNSQNT